MEKILKLNSNEEAAAIYGSLDENLRYAEKEYQVRVSARNYKLRIIGDKKKVEEAYLFFLMRLREFREGDKAPEEVKEKIAALKKAGIKGLPLSVLEPERLEAVKKILNKIKAKKLGLT